MLIQVPCERERESERETERETERERERERERFPPVILQLKAVVTCVFLPDEREAGGLSSGDGGMWLLLPGVSLRMRV